MNAAYTTFADQLEREMREWAEMYAARPVDGTAIDRNNHQWARDLLVVFGWLDEARRGLEEQMRRGA